jgi:hypothetical protein
MDKVFQQSVGSEIFSKYTDRQLTAGQLPLPVFVMGSRVAVNGLMLSPMHGKVCLTVAIQIQSPQFDAALDRLLEDPGSYASPMPGDFAGKSRVYRD